MGLPLGPLFANAFMSDSEEKHIGKLREMGLNTWLRYVDDVYATVKIKGVEEEILLYLNSQNPNIRFSMELENGDSMPFLYVRVTRVNKYIHWSLTSSDALITRKCRIQFVLN
jgi:hypothetical protein